MKKIEEHISLDGIDKAILRMLMDNARTPVQEIARQLNLSGSAVHQRIKKLEDASLIQGSYLKLNPAFLEHTIEANKRKDNLYHAYNLMTLNGSMNIDLRSFNSVDLDETKIKKRIIKTIK